MFAIIILSVLLFLITLVSIYLYVYPMGKECKECTECKCPPPRECSCRSKLRFTDGEYKGTLNKLYGDSPVLTDPELMPLFKGDNWGPVINEQSGMITRICPEGSYYNNTNVVEEPGGFMCYKQVPNAMAQCE
jgi:hypothetical protein